MTRKSSQHLGTHQLDALEKVARLMNEARWGKELDEKTKRECLMEAVNVLVRGGMADRTHVATPSRSAAAKLGKLLEDLLDNPSQRLAVYGTLAPGERNHHVIAHIPGTWEGGRVPGELGRIGSYPAFRWKPRAKRIRVQLLSSSHLPHHWERLDRFEGAAYQRIFAPVTIAGGVLKVANIYEGLELT